MLALETETSWQLHLNDGDRPVNLQGEGFERLSASERAQFLDGVYANAAHGFQYLFNSFPISDVYERGEQLSLYLMRVHEFLNSPGFLDFAREVTGARTITYAAQATLYRPGHFLTHHDDLVKGKNRLVAYVSNITPRWKALPLILAQRERPPMDQRWIAYEARFDSPRRSTWW